MTLPAPPSPDALSARARQGLREVLGGEADVVGWAPGRGPIVAPQGMPWRLDPGTDLVKYLQSIQVAETASAAR